MFPYQDVVWYATILHQSVLSNQWNCDTDQWYVGFVKAVKQSEHFYSTLNLKL